MKSRLSLGPHRNGLRCDRGLGCWHFRVGLRRYPGPVLRTRPPNEICGSAGALEGADRRPSLAQAA